jgi:uncharacterized protein
MNINRRKWLRRAALATVLSPFAALSYGYLEAGWIETTHSMIAVPKLPAEFVDFRIAVLADIHHSSMTPISFVRKVVDQTLEQKPDLIVMVGDFVEGHDGPKCFGPCFDELDRLTAPHGVVAVPGNHDYWNRIQNYHVAIKQTSIQELTNNGLWIRKGNSKLRIGGVDDLWCGKPSLESALRDAGHEDASILMCHNPDYVERITDPRVSLVFSGHLHGGQVCIPFLKGPVPSNYGTKYLKGLVQGPVTQVYVSRGLGTVSIPFRFRARPEIAMVTLTG